MFVVNVGGLVNLITINAIILYLLVPILSRQLVVERDYPRTDVPANIFALKKQQNSMEEKEKENKPVVDQVWYFGNTSSTSGSGWSFNW